MRNIFSLVLAILAVAVSLSLSACGGGGSSAPAAAAPTSTATVPASSGGGASSSTPSPSAPNVVAVTVDGGTNGQAFNQPFVSVTVCLPGTSACQQIDHVLVDTGSFGLRIVASALNGSIALPKLASLAGNTLSECAPFASGIAWGSVRSADVHVGGELASSVPVQLVSDPSIAAAPSSCTSQGSSFNVGNGANGILGIGVFAQDCGSACALGATNPAMYYGCDASSCAPSAAPLASQVTNPIAFFATDNNGASIALPSVPLNGTSTLAGTLTFGIGTQANNQLGSATVFATDANGAVQTTFNGARYTSFFDTGSNALFFPDSSLPQCSGGFYCPSSPLTFSASVTSAAGVSGTVSFTIQSIKAVGTSTAAPVGGNTSGLGSAFDWGLPFFFGRTVFVALQGASTPGGTGPYWAF